MYTFQSRVRYSEATKDQILDLYAILNYFQDCSNFQSADLGVGVQYLTERKKAWLLSAWQVELVRPPHLFEPITIGTWPHDFKGIYGYRNFILYNEARGHEVAAYANSIWFLIDTDTGKPLRIMPEDAAPYPLEPAYPMEYMPRKITLPKIPQPISVQTRTQGIFSQPDSSLYAETRTQDMFSRLDSSSYAETRTQDIFSQLDSSSYAETKTQDMFSQPDSSSYAEVNFEPITVTKIFLDTNNHVNNSQYVRLAQACLPETFRIRRMRAEYRRAAVLGDIIHPKILSSEGKYYVLLNDREETPYAIVEFTAEDQKE